NQSASVVVVDAQESLTPTLVRKLRQDGFSVHTFSNASEAIAYLRQHPVDFVVSGGGTPEMQGRELLNQISSVRSDAIRILVSSPENKPAAVRDLADGLVHSYILKPYNDTGVKSLLHRLSQRQLDLRARFLRDILAARGQLPLPPRLYLRLEPFAALVSRSTQTITSEIEKNREFSLRLLHAANATYYGVRTTINSVRDAVILIGPEYMPGLALAIEAFQSAGRPLQHGSNRMVDQIWHQGLRRATIARMIAGKWTGFSDPTVAYTASLLQDIGYVLRMSYNPTEFATMHTIHQSEQLSLHQAEEKVFDHTHAAVSTALLRFWNLPADIINAISNHHSSTVDTSLTRILQIADIIECGDASIPHDSAVDAQVRQWCWKLSLKLPGGLKTKTS
ncbi:MAG: HDOD domain-containing protein, partial [Bacteroidetes bacterium]|nr:HDOD domain-containing protein [Bacteroidota bacterium]